MKIQVTDQEKMFEAHISAKKSEYITKLKKECFMMHISGKGPVFRIYYQPSTTKNKNKNNRTFKMGKGLTQTLHKRS